MSNLLINKKVNLSKTELYKALKWYKENDELIIKNTKHITYSFILFTLDYIYYERSNDEIRIYKNK